MCVINVQHTCVKFFTRIVGAKVMGSAKNSAATKSTLTVDAWLVVTRILNVRRSNGKGPHCKSAVGEKYIVTPIQCVGETTENVARSTSARRLFVLSNMNLWAIPVGVAETRVPLIDGVIDELRV